MDPADVTRKALVGDQVRWEHQRVPGQDDDTRAARRQSVTWQRWFWSAIAIAWIALTIGNASTIRVVFAFAYAGIAIAWWVIWWNARRKRTP